MCGCSGGASDGPANNASLVSLIRFGKRRVLTLKLFLIAESIEVAKIETRLLERSFAAKCLKKLVQQ